MTEFATLTEVIDAALFPEADMALRAGRHVDRNDGELYTYIVDAAAHLAELYRRYGCELCERPDGYFYLVPVTDRMGKRQLGSTEMLVGQALALLFLDPRTLAGDATELSRADEVREESLQAASAAMRPGLVTQASLVAHLTNLLGRDALIALLTPGRKRVDERIAEEQARARIREGVRKLAALGFVQLVEDDAMLLRPALLRFADPVRGTKDRAAALLQLVASGEIVLSSESEAPAEQEQAFSEAAPDELDASLETAPDKATSQVEQET
jgi:chromosome partition protein MukE